MRGRDDKKGILIIDDSQVIRETLWKIFNSRYRVFLAGTGWEGLKMLSRDISLVFLDLMLPDLSGLDVLVELKKDYPAIPVVVITGHGTEEACINAFRLGARDYIKKPFNTKEMLIKAEILINLSAAQSRKPVSFPIENTIGQKPYHDIPPHILKGILKVKNHIEKNYAMQLDLPSACKMAAMSRTYFCYFFKRLTGHSFKDYLHHVRIQQARGLLKNRDFSIAEVARVLGYDDPNYFSTIFKKITGVPPKRPFTEGTRRVSSSWMLRQRIRLWAWEGWRRRIEIKSKVLRIIFGQKQRKIGQKSRKSCSECDNLTMQKICMEVSG